MQLTTDEIKEVIKTKLDYLKDSCGLPAYLVGKELLDLQSRLYDTQTTRYIPVPQWNLYHKNPTVSAIRNYINNRHNNGFNEVLKRDGKLWYIDEKKFFEWKENRFKETEING